MSYPGLREIVFIQDWQNQDSSAGLPHFKPSILVTLHIATTLKGELELCTRRRFPVDHSGEYNVAKLALAPATQGFLTCVLMSLGL